MTESTPPADFPLERIHAAQRQAAMITAGIASSLVVYAVIVEILRRAEPSAEPVANADLLRIIFFALAGMVIFTATVTKSLLLRNPAPTPEARLARLRSTSVLAAALAEMPAVFGLALFMTTHRRGDFYLLLVVAAYMVVRHFPQREAWELYVRRASDAR
jgi:hypothetical protein